MKRWGESRPACCHVVPVLAMGVNVHECVGLGLATLRRHGSVAAPGFDKPEGVVVYHTASGHLFKVTLENDEARKGAASAVAE